MAYDTIDLTAAADAARAIPAAELARRVAELSAHIDVLWRDALGAGDFVQVERLTAASQALHRAALALRSNGRIGV